MRIAVIGNGAMGTGVAVRLKSRGAEVVTSLAGRSAASAKRAHAAGLTVVNDDDSLIADAAALLSIVPPVHALSAAQRFAPALARHHGGLLYVDCNAIAPETARQVGSLVTAAGGLFVDASIIGGPPRGDAAGPRFYASGREANRFAELTKFGLDIRIVAGDVGSASALKMSYSALTKGLTVLGLLAARGATSYRVADALSRELALSQPMLAAWLAHRVPGAYAKAYRFVGEMAEIARFLDGSGAELFQGAARTYEQTAAIFAANGSDALEELSAVFRAAASAPIKS